MGGGVSPLVLPLGYVLELYKTKSGFQKYKHLKSFGANKIPFILFFRNLYYRINIEYFFLSKFTENVEILLQIITKLNLKKKKLFHFTLYRIHFSINNVYLQMKFNSSNNTLPAICLQINTYTVSICMYISTFFLQISVYLKIYIFFERWFFFNFVLMR